MALALAFMACGAGAAQADKIKNPTAVFSGLDKITGRIVSFEASIGETVQFGSLQMTPRVCYSRPPTESPNTTSFVEIDEVSQDNALRRVFGGWMFASSPGLHGVEHPVYDIWLVECKGGTEIIPEPKEVAEEPPLPEPPARQAEQPSGILAPSIGPAGPAAPRPAPPQQPRQRFFPTNQPPPINNNNINR